MPNHYILGAMQNTADAVERRRVAMLKGALEIAFHREPGGAGYTRSHPINELWAFRFERAEDGRPVLVLHDPGPLVSFALHLPTPGYAAALASLAEPYAAALDAAWSELSRADKTGNPLHRRSTWAQPLRDGAPIPEILREKA